MATIVRVCRGASGKLSNCNLAGCIQRHTLIDHPFLLVVFGPILGAIQVLRNAVGGGWVSAFLEKSVTEVYGSTLLALRGGGWGSNSQVKSVT